MSDHASPYVRPTTFQGRIGRTYRDSTPWWPPSPPAEDRPNVVFIVLDDLGFASLGCFGSEISTPAIDSLAQRGVRFTNFHATALCSPTRASLLTGRNHHAVGMAYLSHVDDGYPGYRGCIGHDSATLAEVLVDAGWNTMALGKWHLAPMDQTSAAGPYDQWPLGRGFERYYGFLDALTDHYYPELTEDNHQVAPPASPGEGYHLSEDLVDHACRFVGDQGAITPDKPFFLYLAFGATHTPFQAPAEFIERYRGVYDVGWDVIRERRYQRQLAEGIIPPGTRLPPRNADVQPWDELSEQEQELAVRFQEVYAGFLEHTDAQIGRLVDYLEQSGRLDNTIVVVLGDNGASQEGGPHGVLNTTAYENGHMPSLEDNLARIDDIDGFTAHVNYPLGWAQAANTPLKRYKQNTHAGGIRTSMIMVPPDGRHAGTTVHGFHHVTDLVPTVLDLAGVPMPTHRNGLALHPLDGVSIAPLLERGPDADGVFPPQPGRTQYFETVGHRAIWKDGWKAVAWHRRDADFDDDQWELYHVDADFSEATDLAGEQPERLASLVEAWWAEAERNLVLPLDDRGFAERANATIRQHSPRDRQRFVYPGDAPHVPTSAAPPVCGRSWRIDADVTRLTGSDDGVLVAHGSVNSGYCLHIADGQLVFDYNYYGDHRIVRSTAPVPLGRSSLGMVFDHDEEGTGASIRLEIQGAPSGEARLEETFEYFVAWQGLDVGADRLSPVRANAVDDGAFRGTLHEVVVEITGSTLAQPAAAAT